MGNKMFNKDYSKPFSEVYLFGKIKLLKIKKPLKKTSSILIVNTCLVGDFVTSLFAIESFIKKNKSPVDIIVSPIQKSMAKRIIGIRNVYVAKSSTERKIEEGFSEDKIVSTEYKKIIILRLSKEAYNIIKNLRVYDIETPIKYFISYGIHLYRNILVRKTPKQWKDMNFEMLRIPKENIEFNDIFKFTKNDFKRINQLTAMKTKQKVVLFHITPSWVMNNWEISKWIKLIKKIKQKFPKYRFIFIGTNGDVKDFKKVESQLDFKIYSIIGKIDLRDLLLVMRKSNYFIGIDSGPANVAHICNLRSLSIMGAGPHMYLPYNKLDIVVDKSHGAGLYQRFFKKRRGFINEISVDEVFSAFKKLNNEN